MVSSGTLLVCGAVLERYLEVLAEHPDVAPPEFRAMVADAFFDVKRAREEEFLGITRAVRAVPAETDRASLLQLTARG